MTREQQLLERIRQLEEINNTLQDKLDMIYSIISPDYEEETEGEPDSATHGLVQIDSRPRPNTQTSEQKPTNQSPNRA